MYIHSTTNGPVIAHDQLFVVLSDDDNLIELCEQDESTLSELEKHILFELKSTFDDYLDAVSNNINAPTQKLYSYISAIQQFLLFKNVKWVQYQIAVKEAGGLNDELQV